LYLFEQGRIPNQALDCSPAGKWKIGQPRMNWTTIAVKKTMESMEMTWEEVDRAAEERTVYLTVLPDVLTAEGTEMTN